MKKLFIPALLFVLSAVPALALDLGDKAPPITVDKWVTGDEADPTNPAEGQFFIIEVWSTTCPPCVRSIPILNDLQKRYADQGLKIVSFTTDAFEEVESFLSFHPMEYSSFIDGEAATYINYMAADNRNTIPHAFLFDKSGVLVWIGNPLDNLESRVKQVLDGTLNGEAAAAIRVARKEFQSALEGQNIEAMLSSLEALEKLEPDNVQYYQVHMRILSQFSDDPQEVQNLMEAWFEGCKDRAEGLIMLAVTASEQGLPELRNPQLGLDAAKRAFALDSTAKLEAGLTLAEVYKSLGRIDLAIDTVAEVSALTEDAEEKEIIGAVAEYYRKAREVGEKAGKQ